MEFLNPLKSTDYPAKSVTYTGTAGSTSDWTPGPEGVMIWSDQDCYVEVGEGVTATTSSTPIPAYSIIPFKVPSGTGAHGVSVQSWYPLVVRSTRNQ